jgi:hypothetical protein
MTDDMTMESREHVEHAEHAAHAQDPLLQRVSITIAALAVVASMVSSLAAGEGASAIGAKNDAVLHQNKATDSWAFFQAKTIKEAVFSIAADAPGPHAAAYRTEAERHRSAVAGAEKQARAEEALSAAAQERAEMHEVREHHLALAETLSHVAIAIGTIAIVTRRRWPWMASILLGFAAIAAGVYAYVV